MGVHDEDAPDDELRALARAHREALRARLRALVEFYDLRDRGEAAAAEEQERLDEFERFILEETAALHEQVKRIARSKFDGG